MGNHLAAPSQGQRQQRLLHRSEQSAGKEAKDIDVDTQASDVEQLLL